MQVIDAIVLKEFPGFHYHIYIHVRDKGDVKIADFTDYRLAFRYGRRLHKEMGCELYDYTKDSKTFEYNKG